MSTNKTCAISSLRWLPVSALIYGLADFSKHEWLSVSLKFTWNNRKQKKFGSILRTGKEKAGRFLKQQITPTPEPELFAVFRTDGGMTRCLGSCPDGGGTIPPSQLVMNKQSTLDQDQKRWRSRAKLHDLAAKKNLKGGSSAKS